MTSYIYFIQAQGNGPIKIGITSGNPRLRMVKIQSDCPWQVNLLGVVRGGLSQEKQIHLLLSRCRTQGEWFKPHPIVLAAVAEALRVGEITLHPKRSGPRHNHPICLYRYKVDLTLIEFAKIMGVSHATLNRIETGKGNPSLGLARRLSQVIGIGIEELLDYPRAEVAA